MIKLFRKIFKNYSILFDLHPKTRLREVFFLLQTRHEKTLFFGSVVFDFTPRQAKIFVAKRVSLYFRRVCAKLRKKSSLRICEIFQISARFFECFFLKNREKMGVRCNGIFLEKSESHFGLHWAGFGVRFWAPKKCEFRGFHNYFGNTRRDKTCNSVSRYYI